jgi:hypothetical protein
MLCAACPNLQTYNPLPGPASRAVVECDDEFIATQQAPFDDRALGDCYTTPYGSYANACAGCHGGGSPDGVGTDWGPSNDASPAGWYQAVVGNALASDLGDIARTDLVRTLTGGESDYHPAQPECATAMSGWLEGFAAGCGGGPRVAPPVDGGTLDAGLVDDGGIDAGEPPEIDAGPVIVPDAGPCPDGGPWSDPVSEAFFIDHGLATKLQTCHGCHNSSPDARNGSWGAPSNTAAEWHTASRVLLSKQTVTEASSTSLVIKLSTQHLSSAPDPVAAGNMADWIDFVWLCEP